MAALSRFIHMITSRAVMGWPSDHCQCLRVMVTTRLPSEKTGWLPMLSWGLKTG